jgi:hypothetical protein
MNRDKIYRATFEVAQPRSDAHCCESEIGANFCGSRPLLRRLSPTIEFTATDHLAANSGGVIAPDVERPFSVAGLSANSWKEGRRITRAKDPTSQWPGGGTICVRTLVHYAERRVLRVPLAEANLQRHFGVHSTVNQIVEQ